jgi:hypothetical protein
MAHIPIRIHFNPLPSSSHLPDTLEVMVTQPKLAGILVGQRLIEGKRFGSFIQNIWIIDPTLHQWRPLDVEDRIEFNRPHHLLTYGGDQGFIYDPTQGLSEDDAWHRYLNWRMRPHPKSITEQYTMQVESPSQGPHRLFEYYQYTDPDFLRGIQEVFEWAGLNWKDYVGPIIQEKTEDEQRAEYEQLLRFRRH